MQYPKKEYLMPIVNNLADLTLGHMVVTFMDRNVGYIQVYIIEKDTLKIAFQCLCPIRSFEYVLFGLKNNGDTYQRAIIAIFNDMISRTIEFYINHVAIMFDSHEKHQKNLK